ncbi:uncharacterized protein LOC119578022 [Penaeus monodon]|uniref:uncharacterized protein LOC119578022 n=1 Tax=Penaeus monodon TaxID=6687 RepID=UPI0018A72483|nr:uncharacterized protein LOC119578022 [Penaeus monodon]
MHAAIKSNKDTAPEIERISYSMISHLGSQATQILLLLFNKSLEAGRLPKAWKDLDIQPIPKLFCRTSLLSCFNITMERAILRRLRFMINHSHKHFFAFCKGFGTGENLATIHSLSDGKDFIIVFLDLEKAFELANKEAIISTLASRGISGKLLQWCNDYLLERKACILPNSHIIAYADDIQLITTDNSSTPNIPSIYYPLDARNSA